MKIPHKAIKASCFALAMSTLSSTAWAQTAEADETTAEPEYGDIIVTATKRAESLNDVPMSISAASGDDLVDAGIRSADDLGKIVPGFTFTQSAYSTPVYSLRGVGFYNYDIASTPTVTVYQDEAPLSFSAMTRGAGFDLERVEVLKGPQGLLFGSNSTGGAVNYIAARPTDTFTAGLDASYGRFDAWELGGFFSAPLGEDAGVRLAMRHEGSGEWQQSATRPNDGNGKRNFTQMRALFDLTPTDRLSIKLSVGAFWDRSDAQAAQLIQVNPLLPPFVNPQTGAQPIVNDDARIGDWTSGTNPKRDDNQRNMSARIDYDITDAITVTSLTSYAHYRQDDVLDPDGTALVLADTRDEGEIKAFSQELRIAGEFGNGSRWIIGGNYENNTVTEVQTLSATQASGFAPFAIFFGLPIPDLIPISSEQKFKNYAVFGNVDLAVTDSITVHAGLRYTDTSDSFVGCTGNSANGSLAIGLGILSQGNPAALGPNPVCTQLNAQLQPTETRAKLAEDNLSWRVGLDYKPNNDTLLYANVSRGYKIGAFPLIPASSVAQYTPVTQESLTAYEAGFKLGLADGRVQLNGALFHYDYRDKQTLGSVILTPDIFGPLNLLVNIPKSKVTGAEFQAIVRLTTGLTLNGAVTYVDSEIGAFTNFDPFGVVKNFKGEAFPNTPKWQWSLAADYQFPVSGGVNGFFGANLNGRSDANGALGQNAILAIDGYTLLDLRAGVSAADDAWKVSIWGRNVTDQYYWTNAYKISDVSARFAGMPATYGVSVSFRY